MCKHIRRNLDTVNTSVSCKNSLLYESVTVTYEGIYKNFQF
jgi:hypothetical protein